MTDEQIIKIAENHFFCNVSVMEYIARREDIIKFARAIYSISWKECIDRWNHWDYENDCWGTYEEAK